MKAKTTLEAPYDLAMKPQQEPDKTPLVALEVKRPFSGLVTEPLSKATSLPVVMAPQDRLNEVEAKLIKRLVKAIKAL